MHDEWDYSIIESIEGYAVSPFSRKKGVIMTTENKITIQHSDNLSAESEKPCKQRTYSVLEIADILQISKSKAYALCKESLFKSVKIGKYVRISKTSFDAWLDNSE